MRNYYSVTDHEAIREIFPKAEFVYIPDASHYVHAEKPREFLDVLNKFLAQ